MVEQPVLGAVEILHPQAQDLAALVAEGLAFVAHGDGLSVEEQLAGAYLDAVARKADDALHEALGAVVGTAIQRTHLAHPARPQLEDHDVASAGLAQRGQAHVREGNPGAVRKLVHDHVVADQKRGQHGPRRHVEGLDHQGPDHQRQRHAPDQRGHLIPGAAHAGCGGRLRGAARRFPSASRVPLPATPGLATRHRG
jgi:hypothetical protein